MHQGQQFFNFYNHDLIRVAAATPWVRVADPAFNAAETVSLMEQAARSQVILMLFPNCSRSTVDSETVLFSGSGK